MICFFMHSLSESLACSFQLAFFLLSFHSFLTWTLTLISFFHSFILSFVRLFVRSFIHSFIHSFVRSFARSFVHSFIHPNIISSFHPFIHSSVHPFIRSSILPFIFPFQECVLFSLFQSFVSFCFGTASNQRLSWYIHLYDSLLSQCLLTWLFSILALTHALLRVLMYSCG